MSRRGFQCSSCPFSTLHHSALSNHVRNKHENHNMMCDKCDFTTYTKLSFKRHIEKEHSDKVLPCDSCEFTTKTNEQLRKHKRKHSGLTLTCEYDGCVSVFNFKSDYLIHVNAVHKKIRYIYLIQNLIFKFVFLWNFNIMIHHYFSFTERTHIGD